MMGLSRTRHRPTRRDRAMPGAAWEVAGLAMAGAGIAIYLSVTKLVRATPLLCGAGGSCELVQASHYALLFGVPTAAWGAGLYLALVALSVRPLTGRRWLWSFGLAVAGAAFSCYLTGVSLLVLHAACGWCVTSAVIVCVIVVALLRRRPPPGSRQAWLRPWRLATLGGLVAITTTGAAFAIFNTSVPTSPYQEALARHLRATGARFYGAYWCPHCQEQKRLFGEAADELPYVECDPSGTGARPDLCARADVRVFPTWVIGAARREGTMTLDTLAELSGFKPAPPAVPAVPPMTGGAAPQPRR